MSILGDKLNQYITASGYTVYKLSQVSGVNRTTIVRMLNANRLPERRNMEHLIPYLKLTNDERKDLWRTYEMMSSGEELFYQRQYVLDMMLAIYNPPERQHISPFRAARVDTGETFDPIETPCIMSGKYEVAHALSLIMLSEDAKEICIFAPFQNDFLSEFFGHFSRNTLSEVHIHHMMHLIKKPADITQVNYNLSVLSHVLPLSLAEDIDYHAYYSYVNNTISNESQILFPFYVIIGNMLIELAYDFSSARFTSDPDIVQYYRNSFETLRQETRELVEVHSSFSEIMSEFKPAETNQYSTSSISTHPRIVNVFDKSILSHMIRTDIKTSQFFEQLFQNHLTRLTSIKNRTCFFPITGLEDLVYNGRITDIPHEYVVPVPVEDRMIILERLRVECMKESCKIRLTNPITFPMKSNITIQSTSDQRVVLLAVDHDEKKFRYLEVDEPSLTDSLVDFLEYMGNDFGICSDYVYSRDQTLETIDHYMDELENMLPSE